MTSRSPLSPKLLKGAFIRLDDMGVAVVPQIIVFQFNPETLTRKFKPFEKPVDKEGSQGDPNFNKQPYDPDEEMEVVVEVDATDDLEEPEQHPIAVVSGVAARVAAMEMLMYPTTEAGLLSSAVASLAGALFGGEASIPEQKESPVVLFVWGPGRIVPVKITSFSVEEQAFNAALYPIRAKVSVGIKVLTDANFAPAENAKSLRPAQELAKTAYRYTVKQRKALAAANVANSTETILSLLPF